MATSTSSDPPTPADPLGTRHKPTIPQHLSTVSLPLPPHDDRPHERHRVDTKKSLALQSFRPTLSSGTRQSPPAPRKKETPPTPKLKRGNLVAKRRREKTRGERRRRNPSLRASSSRKGRRACSGFGKGPRGRRDAVGVQPIPGGTEALPNITWKPYNVYFVILRGKYIAIGLFIAPTVAPPHFS